MHCRARARRCGRVVGTVAERDGDARLHHARREPAVAGDRRQLAPGARRPRHADLRRPADRRPRLPPPGPARPLDAARDRLPRLDARDGRRPGGARRASSLARMERPATQSCVVVCVALAIIVTLSLRPTTKPAGSRRRLGLARLTGPRPPGRRGRPAEPLAAATTRGMSGCDRVQAQSSREAGSRPAERAAPALTDQGYGECETGWRSPVAKRSKRNG